MKALADEKATESISELNDRITNEQFTQDVPIWENRSIESARCSPGTTGR